MGYYLYKHLCVPNEDEHYTIEELYKMAKSNVRTLRNINFYIQGQSIDTETNCVNDIKEISERLYTFYFDFFIDDIDIFFIDEPLKIEVLTRNHINELVSVYEYYSKDIDTFKPSKEIIKYTNDLQSIILQVIERLNFFTSERRTDTIEIKPPISSELSTPFRDKETKDFFDYLVINWNNKNANKWGYIWRFLVDEGKGKLTTKTDYENYLRTYKGFNEGKPNYDSCNSQKHYDKLTELYKKFKQI